MDIAGEEDIDESESFLMAPEKYKGLILAVTDKMDFSFEVL